MTNYHIAQVNIARMLGPIDCEIMASFVRLLEPINTLGEQSPGFVWRLKDDSGTATSIQVYNDPMLIVNLSVWESIDALYQYAYYSDHAAAFRRRREWFEKLEFPAFCLWWVAPGYRPSALEAKARLEYLKVNGPTPHAFTFRERFEPLLPSEWQDYPPFDLHSVR